MIIWKKKWKDLTAKSPKKLQQVNQILIIMEVYIDDNKMW